MIAILVTVIVAIPLGHAFSVSQPYYVVGNKDQVSLHCDYNISTQPEEMQVTLYKGMYGKEKICSVFVNLSDPHIVKDGRVNCRGNVSKGRVDLTIFGLKGEDTDLYRCQVDIFFPPPYQRVFGNGTLVYIPESPNCPSEHTQARIQEIPEITPTQTPALHLLLLSAILITTTIALILQMVNMTLTQMKSTRLPPVPGNYKNFW